LSEPEEVTETEPVAGSAEPEAVVEAEAPAAAAAELTPDSTPDATAEGATAEGATAEGATAEATAGVAPEASAEAAPEAGPPDPPSGEMPEDKILDPATLRFFRAEDGVARLELAGDRSLLGVSVSRLFPITQRLEFLTLADATGEEVGILRDLRALPKAMRRIVLEELRKRYLVPQITYVHSLRTEYGILYWDVETSRGRREFVVREVRDNIREFAGNRLQITDVDGNQFEIRNSEELRGKGINELYRLM
jgi:hypothetical protein